MLFKFKNIQDTEAGCLVGIIDSLFPLTLFHTLEFKLAKLKSKSIAGFFCEKFCSFFNNFFEIIFLSFFLRGRGESMIPTKQPASVS